MTIDEIVSAIRALPVPERLRVIERVAHEAATEVPPPENALPPGFAGVALIERSGMLVIDTSERLAADAFDHRADRDARASRTWGGS